MRDVDGNLRALGEQMLFDALTAAEGCIEELEEQNAILSNNLVNAKQLQQALAMPEIKALVDALHKSADGWDNVIGMGLIAKKHFGSARVLRDEAFDALQRVGVEL